MSGFPQFPLDGTVLSTNVTSDRFSLVSNKIGNKYYPIGQYLFYTKNNSIWYKFKTTTQNWSNEVLWIGSAINSNTKFDSNGYPITAYIALDGSVNVNRFDDDGNFLTNTVATSGFLPTIAINYCDTYLFWVPPTFTNFVYYSAMGSDFSTSRVYTVNVPGQLGSMQIESVSNNRFMFSFEVDDNISQKVYVAFTNPAFVTTIYNLSASVNFSKQ